MLNTSTRGRPIAQAAIAALLAFPPAEKKFADETPAQRAQHHEIERRYRRRKRGTRGGPKTNVRITDLDRLLVHRYGEVLPDDDAGADDIFIMANHLAHLKEPEMRIRAWLRCRGPWYTEERTKRLIEKVLRKPLKWTADKLGQLLRLDDATRTRLGISTIGGYDCLKAKRASRRRKKDAARHRKLRAKAGAKPRALSEAQTEPWLEEGISESTYRRRKRRLKLQIDSGDSNTSAAYTKYICMQTKHCHPTGAQRPEGRASARAVPALSAVEATIAPETPADRIFPNAAREAISKCNAM